jgi:hypothetical protein
MRSAAGVLLIADGIAKFRMGASFGESILDVLAIGDGAFLVAGLWTPLAGSLAVALVVLNTIAQHGNLCPGILLAAIGAALALIGPGAWSIDAWLFGWKRIDIERR